MKTNAAISVTVLLTLLAVAPQSVAKTAYFHTDDDAWGITPLPATLNTWTTSPMHLRTTPAPADRVVTGEDFFLKELGAKLPPFGFTDGYKSETWGRTKDNPDAPAIRFGRGWGSSQGRAWGVRADITQDADETEWSISLGRPHKFKIKAPKGKRTTVLVQTGVVRGLQGHTSLSFACLTTNVAVKVHSFELVPFTEPISWRGTFVLDFKPWKAGLSFQRRNHYTFKINGRTVSTGPQIDNPDILKEEIADYLHEGTNVFDVITQRTDGYCNEAELVVEAFAVSETGERKMLLAGSDWQAKYKTGKWTKVSFSSNPANRMGGDWSPGKVACSTGINPMHAGPLQVKHLGPEYPVFDSDDAEIAYAVATPPKMKGLEIGLVVSNALEGRVVERVRVGVGVRERNLTTCSAGQPERNGETPLSNSNSNSNSSVQPAGQPERNGETPLSSSNSNSNSSVQPTGQPERNGETPLSNSNSNSNSSRLILKTREPGPYRLYWTLFQDGKEIDRDSMECIIAGPIEQTECPFNEYDKVLESRMKLIQTRDCVPEEKDPMKFAEHGAIHSDLTRANIKSKVGCENGISFREAGRLAGDWFGYKLDIAKTGIPHILEVDYPDTHEQVLYVSVCENLPANFCNHGPGSANRQCNATGAVRTGFMAPLSGQKKTMRVLFFPASKNVTVTFENYSRASVCGFRVYEVPEGLPALKLPETERLWGTHCERPLTGIWGAAMNAKARIVYGAYIENAYLAAYLGIKNRIAELRYLGQNLAIEGVYMYKQYFPTLSGESQSATPSFDYCYIMSKMYRHNRIRALAGFEYFSAPSLALRNGHDIGEREMRASKVPCTPSFGVDRHGRQTIVFNEAGLNCLAPHVWGSMTNLLTEIYRRYEPTGGFEGLFVICNNGWIPGFCSIRDRYTEREVGYDDLSVELFQKETGVKLAIPYTPDRFAKRYEALNGKYEKEWYAWRSLKMRQAFEAFQSICSTGARKWKVYAVPGVEHKVNANPFTRMTSSAADRDGYAERPFRECGYPPDVYSKASGSTVGLVPRMKFARELDLPLWGVMTSESARRMYGKTDAVYLEPIGLNERWLSTQKLEKWWWDGQSSIVFNCKASEPATYFDMVDICAGHAPKLMVHNWLDVNIPTGHGRESRRFATGFVAMPVGDYRPFPAVKGVQAEICGTDAVRLVNDTPYELKGELVARSFAFPVNVTDAFAGKQSGKFAYTLPGFGITVLRSDGIAKKLSGSFAFADPAVTATVMKRAEALAGNRIMQEQISAGVRARFQDAWAKRNVYALAAVLRDFEVRRVADKFFDLVLDAPQKPAAELRVQGKYLGQPRRYKEGDGWGCGQIDKNERDTSRRFTLSFLVKTDGRAGDLCVNNTYPFRCDIRTFAGREGLPKEYTDLNVSITCFRTKPGQKGWYPVGMPLYDGAPKNVWHHICMTVDPEGIGTVWVDGNLIDARELTDHHGVTFESASTGISFGRVCPRGMTEAGLTSAWMMRREGVMDWRDIQKEAVEWLEAARKFQN